MFSISSQPPPRSFAFLRGIQQKHFLFFLPFCTTFLVCPPFLFVFKFSFGRFFQLKLIKVGGRPESHEGGDGDACDLEPGDRAVGEHDDDHYLDAKDNDIKGEVNPFFLFHHWVRIGQTKTSYNRQFSPKRPEVGQIFILKSQFG